MKQHLLVNSRPKLAAILACAAALLLTPALWAADPDLPFDSGSTGADGALTFREIPTGRTYPALAYDAARQEVVLFGGYVGAGLADTWTWRGSNWVRQLPATSPVDRWGAQMVFDAARQEVVLFGGTRSTGRLNDTWVWNGTTWVQRTPATVPSARDNFSMAYDAARQRVVMFGGNNGGQETWLWDGTNWTLANPANRPQATSSSAMAYDPIRQECVLFGNYGQTWIWNGTDWTQRGSFNVPQARNFSAMAFDGTSNTILLVSGSNLADVWFWNGTDWAAFTGGVAPDVNVGRQYHAMVWDATRQRVVLFGGDVPGVDNYSADTLLWNGTSLQFYSGKIQYFDMSGRANGTWNFTTIRVPSGINVRFKKNAGNTPVRWLASGEVTIDGTIDVDGEFGSNALAPGVAPKGGPGGYDGGRGGVAFNSSASFVGSPGQGPGGGLPGTAQQTNPDNLRDGKPASYVGPTTTYGNAFLQPLLGGSGGGGGSSSDVWNGGNGGGGGGAILISSKRDITLNGYIHANGGEYQWSNASYGGRGSGGAILLRADRVTGGGTLQAYGGNQNNPNGRIRVEAYSRTLTGSRVPPEIVALPAANGELNQVGTLTIQSVAGAGVTQPPSGNLLTPDVVFNSAGTVTVVVAGTGVPNGTAVRLRITTSSGVIDATPQDMVNGTATFSVTVPKGLGTLQASAQFTQN